jgi:hypothetical protein
MQGMCLISMYMTERVYYFSKLQSEATSEKST